MKATSSPSCSGWSQVVYSRLTAGLLARRSQSKAGNRAVSRSATSAGVAPAGNSSVAVRSPASAARPTNSTVTRIMDLPIPVGRVLLLIRWRQQIGDSDEGLRRGERRDSLLLAVPSDALIPRARWIAVDLELPAGEIFDPVLGNTG